MGAVRGDVVAGLCRGTPLWRFAALSAVFLTFLLIMALPRLSEASPASDDAPVMGRSYTGTVRAAGFVAPLPPGSWILISEDTREISSQDGAGFGRRFYFAKIVDHRLMGLAHVVAYRRTAGSLATFSEPFLPPQTCEPVKPEDPGHWKCAKVFVANSDDWSRSSDPSARLSSEDRLAAQALAAKDLPVPQMMIAVQMYRSEAWGAMLVEYSSNPEEAGIFTRPAPTPQESDWAPANMAKSPERSAYFEKIRAWTKATYPTFKDDFAQSEPGASQPAADVAPSAPPVTGPAPSSTDALSTAASTAPPAGGALPGDAAALGRTFTGSILTNGYNVPLPAGSWTVITNITHNFSFKGGAGLERRLFFAKIVDHRLLGLAHVVTYRRTAGSLATLHEVTLPPEMCEPGKADDPGHWKCAKVSVADFDGWSRPNDASASLSSEDRMAAQALAARGLSFPQILISAQIFRSESWGALSVEYVFNPEEAGIVTRSAPTSEESDWTPANIKNSPERSAYFEKIRAWAKAIYPMVKDDFAQSEPGGSQPVANVAPAAPSAKGPAPSSTGALSTAASTAPSAGGPPPGDATALGRTFTGSILTNGYNVPLPAGSWTVITDITRNVASKDGAVAGRILYLGKIVDHRLLGLVHVAAYRRMAGSLATLSEPLPPTACEPAKADDPGHWTCATASYVYLGNWRQWSDRSAPLHPDEREVARELTARGVPLVQDVIAVRMFRSEPWGALFTEYMFNPEEAGISSVEAPSMQDSDWTPEKIQKSPERSAYFRKITSWGNTTYGAFKADFDQSASGADAPDPSELTP
jgi:hypothetical protein